MHVRDLIYFIQLLMIYSDASIQAADRAFEGKGK